MLEARDATVAIDGRTLLDAVDLRVAPGEWLAIVGENGAGKSTLLRFLAGERFAARARLRGEARLAGRNILDWTVTERARLRAVVTQRPNVAFAFTAREVARLGRYAAGGGGAAQERAIADAALELTGTAHLADREVATLSGGEMARVHLAAAFAQLWETECAHGRYLLLDEPTAALDLAHQHALLATSREFAQVRGIGVIAILHDLNLAASYADRMIVMQSGRVLAEGTPSDVLQPATIARGFAVQAQVLRHPLTAGILIATAAMR